MLGQKRHQTVGVGVLDDQQLFTAGKIGFNIDHRLITAEKGGVRVLLLQILPEIHTVINLFIFAGVDRNRCHIYTLWGRIIVIVNGIRTHIVIDHLGIQSAQKAVRGVFNIKAAAGDTFIPECFGSGTVPQIGAEAGPVMVGLIINILVL